VIATLYSTVDGRVIEVFAGDTEWMVLNLGDDEALAEGDHLGKRIDIETGEALPLQTFDLSVSPGTITGIPAGTTATVRGEMLTVDDGTLEIETNLPATIPVRLNHPLYEEETIEVICEAQD
jgi:hypothetical protein